MLIVGGKLERIGILDLIKSEEKEEEESSMHIPYSSHRKVKAQDKSKIQNCAQVKIVKHDGLCFG